MQQNLTAFLNLSAFKLKRIHHTSFPHKSKTEATFPFSSRRIPIDSGRYFGKGMRFLFDTNAVRSIAR
jgi:hypothetical protein